MKVMTRIPTGASEHSGPWEHSGRTWVRRSQHPLGRRDARTLDLDSVPQRAGAGFERRLDDVVGVAAPDQLDVQRVAGFVGEGPRELLDELRIERRIAQDLLARELDLVDEERTAR